MNGRFIRIVLKAEKGITFEVSKGAEGEVAIQARYNYYSDNYVRPPIPTGWKHLEGKWDDGFVIERDFDGSQFVWVPVGFLEYNGTLDGVNFCEKFGRRNYQDNVFSEEVFHEDLDCELLKQVESVKKHGGFYISRYNISEGPNGWGQSVKGAVPWTSIDFYDAKKIAASMVVSEEVSSHLTYGAEYDSMLEWFIESYARTTEEIMEDSTMWGNNSKNENSPYVLMQTGSREEWQTCKIYDVAGNVDEWTMEEKDDSIVVIRGYDYRASDEAAVSTRGSMFPTGKSTGTGFRVALYIK